jgi:hypothetical protein
MALVSDYISESERRDEPAAIVALGDRLAGSRRAFVPKLVP